MRVTFVLLAAESGIDPLAAGNKERSKKNVPSCLAKN